MGSLSPEGRSTGADLAKSSLDELKKSISGAVIVKGEASDEDYKDAIDRWSQVSIKEAQIVVYVENEQDISTTIKFVTKHNLDVAMAGGRHSYHGASSSTGLVIDLRRMNALNIDKAAKTITAQGGCRAYDLEVALEKENLSVVMGHVNDTGIGGLTTGGGSGWLTGQHGNIVDNLLGARVALADGKIVTASQDENPDLFWAIRGGGSNFGICTEFTYQAHDQGDVFFGVLFYDIDKLDANIALVPQIYDLICQSKGKFQAFFNMVPPPGTSDLSPMWVIMYDGPESTARSIAAPLFDLSPSLNTTKMTTYRTCNELHKQFHPSSNFKRSATSTAQLSLPLSTPILSQSCLIFKHLMNKHGPKISPSFMVLELQSPHISKRVPIDAMAFANRHESLALSINLKWDDAAFDLQMRKETLDFVADVRAIGRPSTNRGGAGGGALDSVTQIVPPSPQTASSASEQQEEDKDEAEASDKVTVYANYSTGNDKPINVFGSNLPRLRRLKKKYDPDVLWDKWYCIKPSD